MNSFIILAMCLYLIPISISLVIILVLHIKRKTYFDEGEIPIHTSNKTDYSDWEDIEEDLD